MCKTFATLASAVTN